MIITDLWKALKAGEELSNPAAWKKGQNLTNLVGGVVAGVIALIRWKFPDAPIPDEIKDCAVEIVAAVLVAINLYLTPATTKKIGM